MLIKIKPSALKGSVRAPASKSMAHRLLICAGLSQGESHITNVAYSQDILATLDCLETMGAEIERGDTFVKIRGAEPSKISENKTFCCRESGSTLRFFVPLSLLSEKEHTFTGYGRLMERPMEVYEKLQNEKGESFLKREDGKILLKGRLSSGIFNVRGDISSQFISGLLFALPLCDGDSEIHLTGKVESRSYIDMTVDAMAIFGVTVLWKDENTLFIKGKQKYNAQNFEVEGDYSNAAFLDAFTLLGGEVEVLGLKENSLQGDRIYRLFFEKIKNGSPTLDIGNCPDLAPILMTAASFFSGALLKGTKRLKIKESDRGAVMKEELSAFGADIELYEDEILIKKSVLHPPSKRLCGHNDHRVVMSLAVLASVFGGEIEGAEAVNKSYPDFFEKAKTLGLEADINDGK